MHLQSLYLAFLWREVRGWPPPAGRGARLYAGTAGSLNALKSCSVPGRIRPGPPRTGGFQAKPSWRRGLLFRGWLASASSHCPARRDGRAGGASWGPGGDVTAGDGRWDKGLLGNVPLLSLRSLPPGCPAQYPSWGVSETRAMEGAACWLGVRLLVLGSILGGDEMGSSPAAARGDAGSGEKPPLRLVAPASTGPPPAAAAPAAAAPAAAALCKR